MTQIVIVGAGPTGVVTALLLVRNGIKVTLIEAAPNFERLFRGEGLMPSGLDALEQIGLLELVADIPHQAIDAWEFLLSGKRLFRVAEPLEKDGRHCTTVSQPHLLRAIVEEAQQYPEFEFISGEPVREIIYTANRVSGVKLGSGIVTADLVIAGDGRNSAIRKQAGLHLNKQQNNINILWFKLDSGKLSDTENIFYSILKGRASFGMFRGSSNQLHIGWGLHPDDNYDWNIDWATKLAATSPPWLAEHILSHRQSLTQPMLLSVVVGCCDRWSIPGLLLLGDAVHPMSPIRAQGINMAFRDAIIAVNHLVPPLKRTEDPTQIDAVLPLIQQEREPEIKRIQQLQKQEMAQAKLLHHSSFIRWGAKTFTPIIRPAIRASWLKRQQQLRQGVTDVHLKV